MQRPTRWWHRLRHVTLVATLALASAAMLANGVPSSALANSTFNCESRSGGKTCLTVSGPNEYMEEGEGDNYTHPEFELVFWEFNGGSSYTDIWHKIFDAYSAYHCYSSRFDGHLEVAANLEYDNLAGNQKENCLA